MPISTYAGHVYANIRIHAETEEEADDKLLQADITDVDLDTIASNLQHDLGDMILVGIEDDAGDNNTSTPDIAET